MITVFTELPKFQSWIRNPIPLYEEMIKLLQEKPEIFSLCSAFDKIMHDILLKYELTKMNYEYHSTSLMEFVGLSRENVKMVMPFDYNPAFDYAYWFHNTMESGVRIVYLTRKIELYKKIIKTS